MVGRYRIQSWIQENLYLLSWYQTQPRCLGFFPSVYLFLFPSISITSIYVQHEDASLILNWMVVHHDWQLTAHIPRGTQKIRALASFRRVANKRTRSLQFLIVYHLLPTILSVPHHWLLSEVALCSQRQKRPTGCGNCRLHSPCHIIFLASCLQNVYYQE